MNDEEKKEKERMTAESLMGCLSWIDKITAMQLTERVISAVKNGCINESMIKHLHKASINARRSLCVLKRELDMNSHHIVSRKNKHM